MKAGQQKSIQKQIAVAIKSADSSYFFEDYSKQASAVLSALESAGFALTPKEPSDSMVEAGINAIASGKIRPEDHVRYVYMDMVKAGASEKRK